MKLALNLSLLLLIFSLVFWGAFVATQTKNTSRFYQFLKAPKVEAFDFDDISNVTSQIWHTIGKPAAEAIVLAAADKLLRKMVNDTINWANGGFDGEGGFVDNWDDFLKGTSYEVMNSAFQKSLVATKQIIAEHKEIASMSRGLELDSCIAEITLGAESEQACHNEYDGEIEDCSGLDDTDDNGGLGTDYEMCEEANQGVELSLEVCINNVDYYNQQVTRCIEQYGGQADREAYQAQQNYNAQKDKKIRNSRKTAKTIASAAVNKLNVNEVESLIKGEGRTIDKIVNTYGENSGVAFLGYLDPHNNEVGSSQIVAEVLGKEESKELKKSLDKLQTPIKFLDKTECAEYEKNADGTKGKCKRKITLTPGDQISHKIGKALDYDQDKATFANGLKASLLSAIGQLTDGLLDAGLSNLSQSAEKAFFSKDEVNKFTGNNLASGNYQSEYNVLGIESDIENIDFGSEAGHLTGNFSGELNTSFIGGPEDIGNSWNGGAQVIINLKDNLEQQINFVTQELDYYNEMQLLIKGGKKTSIILDHCIPGPDYGWEKKASALARSSMWNDLQEQDENFSKETLKTSVAETKSMVRDPMINIPGYLFMRGSFDQLVQLIKKQSENKIRIDALNGTKAIFSGMLSGIKADFEQYKNTLHLHPDLVITQKEWNDLPENKQIEAFKFASDFEYDASSPYYGNTYNYYVLKTGETPESIVQNDNKKAMQTVLDLAWDVWRSETEVERKKNLRYSYYSLEQDLSSSELVEIAKAKNNQLKQLFSDSKKITADCLLFRSYALGEPVSRLQDVVNQNTTTVGNSETRDFDAIIHDVLALNTANTTAYYGLPSVSFNEASTGSLFGAALGGGAGALVGNLVGNLASSVRGIDDFPVFLSVPHARSDTIIKSFLEEQRNYDRDNNPATKSIFSHNSILFDGVESSILGFSSEVEKDNYFDARYHVGGRGRGLKRNSNAKTVKDIYRKDFAIQIFGVKTHNTSLLFCRSNARFSPPIPIKIYYPFCAIWSRAENVEYESLFAGII